MRLSTAVITLRKRREWLDANIRRDGSLHDSYSAERAALDIALSLMIAEMRVRNSTQGKPPGERREAYNSVTEMFES